MAKDKKQDNPATEQDPAPTVLEWSVRIVSLLLVLGFIGYFVFKAVQPTERPSFDLTVDTDKIAQRDQSWVVPVDVKNNGTMSIHTLTVKGVLKHGEGKEEESISVKMLGSKEKFTVEFWFDHRPIMDSLTFDIGSYLLP